MTDDAVWRDAVEQVVDAITSYAYDEKPWEGLGEVEQESLKSYWVALILEKIEETQGWLESTRL